MGVTSSYFSFFCCLYNEAINEFKFPLNLLRVFLNVETLPLKMDFITFGFLAGGPLFEFVFGLADGC